MTSEELKKMLKPDTYECEMCKKQYGTTWEAVKCGEKDEIHLRAEKEKKRLAEEKAKSDADKLKQVLESNL